jgi:hypothetical protein
MKEAMENMRNAYKVLIGKVKTEKHIGRLGVDVLSRYELQGRAFAIIWLRVLNFFFKFARIKHTFDSTMHTHIASYTAGLIEIRGCYGCSTE